MISEERQDRRLSASAKNFLLIQVDGGGIKGITPSVLLEKLENAFRSRSGCESTKLRDITSVCSGTSTGAVIIGGVVAGVPAGRVADYYRQDAYNLIRKDARLPLSPIFQHNFRRSSFQQQWFNSLEEAADYSRNVRLSELSPSPLLVISAYNLVGRHTVFLSNSSLFESPENAGQIQLVDAMSASALSAPVFFGKLSAPQVRTTQMLADGTSYDVQGAAFADGGQGTQQSTLLVTAHEAIRIALSNPDSLVTVLSFGCGNDFSELTPRAVGRLGKLRQLFSFMSNSQSRGEAIYLQWMAARRLETIIPNLQVIRIDWHHASKRDATSLSVTPKQRDFLLNKAEEIAVQDRFGRILEDFSNPACEFVQFNYSETRGRDR